MWNHTFTIASLCVLCFLCKYVILSIWVYYTLTPFYFIHRGNGLMVSHTKIRQHILASSHDVLCHILQPVDKTDNSTTDYCLNSDASYMDGILLGFVIFTCSIYNTIGLLCLKRRTLVTISCMISTLMGFMLNTIKSHLLQLFVLVYFIVSITSCIPLLFAAITDTLPTHLRWVETSSICFGENCIICFPFFCRGLGISLAMTFGRFLVVISSYMIDHFVYEHCFITLNIYVTLILREFEIIQFLIVINCLIMYIGFLIAVNVIFVIFILH